VRIDLALINMSLLFLGETDVEIHILPKFKDSFGEQSLVTIRESGYRGNEGLVLRLSSLHTASSMAPNKQFIKKLRKQFIDNKQAHRLLKRAAGIAIKKQHRDTE
jgi:hypothetical protein